MRRLYGVIKGKGRRLKYFISQMNSKRLRRSLKDVKLKETKRIRWRDMAILYRSNALSRQFEAALMKHTWKNGDQWMQGIPYEVVGGTEFYERREVKDLCAYLRVIVNPLGSRGLIAHHQSARRGIGEETLDIIDSLSTARSTPFMGSLTGVVRAILVSFI